MKIVVATRSTLGHQTGGMEVYVDHQLEFLCSLDIDLSIITTPGMSKLYKDKLFRHSVNVIEISGSRSHRYDNIWHSKIADILVEVCPDAVIFHGVAGASFSNPGQVKAITLTHGCFLLSISNSIAGERKLISFLSRLKTFLVYREYRSFRHHELVALSDYDKKWTSRSYGIPRQKITVIPPAIVSGVRRISRHDRIVFAGRLEKLKGVHLIIDAWRKVDTNGYELVIAGEGSQRLELEARALGDTSIRFVGRLDYDELQLTIAKSKWSVTGGDVRESFGLAAAESLAAGTPVIHKQSGALPETVGSAGIGYSSNPALVEALEVALKLSHDDWLKMSSYAYANSESYSEQNYVNQWKKLLDSVFDS